MICRHYQSGQKLDVANLNELIVLIDRSETALTEVALNSWRAGLVGPPHSHEAKEQIFYFTSGQGHVILGNDKFAVGPGGLVYVPPGVIHQTIAGPAEPLTYLLFNAFLDAQKEGHASYIEHIEKMKAVRKKQAEMGMADIGGSPHKALAQKPGRHLTDVRLRQATSGPNHSLALLKRSETARSAVELVTQTAGTRGAVAAVSDEERTFFVLSGSGKFSVGEEISDVGFGHVVFVPRNTPQAIQTDQQKLSYLCFSTQVDSAPSVQAWASSTVFDGLAPSGPASVRAAQ